MPDPTPPDPTTDLVAQYELGDTAPDPVLIPSEPRAPATPPTPPRDPATGRFVPTSQTFEHSAHLTRMAGDLLGYSAEEVQAIDPQTLLAEVSAANRALLRDRQDQARADIQANRSSPASREAPPIAPPPSPPEEELSFEIEDHEGWHPAILKALDVVKEQAKKIKTLEEKLNGLDQRESQRAFQTEAERYDAYFAKHPAVFGEGTGQDLADDPAQASFYARRLAILREVGFMNQQKKKGTFEQKAERARKMLFEGVGAAPASKPTAPAQRRTPYGQEPDDWARAGLQRPTNRQTADDLPPGEERAARNLQRAMIDNGLLAAEDTAADGFLE